jgi:putative PIN family toxin of toxin-antitoxin system
MESVKDLPKVVFDTTSIFAATYNPHGVAARALQLMAEGKIKVILSNRLRSEYEETITHPAHLLRFPYITREDLWLYLNHIDQYAERVPNPPPHLPYPRDPDDEHIVNLVIDIQADYLVTIDKDLLALSQYPPFQTKAANTIALRPGAFMAAMERHLATPPMIQSPA